jgi:transcription termination factor NusB
MSKFWGRTAARLVVVQALYAKELGAAGELSTVVAGVMSLYGRGVVKFTSFKEGNPCVMFPDVEFLRILSEMPSSFSWCDADALIKEAMSGDWKYERTSIMVRLIIKTAMFEANVFKETPKAVLIEEYLSIAQRMCDKNEVGFVNKILDKVLLP